MYSPEVIEKTIRAMDTQTLAHRLKQNLFSEESLPIAQNELMLRGIDPEEPTPTQESRPVEPISNFSLSDLPFWKRLFTFKGRATRLKFWLIVPAAWLSFIVLRVLMEVLFERVSYSMMLLSVFGPLVPIAWLHWATVVQRLHDRNKSGYVASLLFIPILGPLWALLELGCFPGTPGPNRFGRN